MTQYVITQKINHYRKMLIFNYQSTNKPFCEEIVASSYIHIDKCVSKFSNGEIHHSLTFYIHENLYLRLGGLNKINTFQVTLKYDFNRLLHSTNERIDNVSIEIFNSDIATCNNAIRPDNIVEQDGDNSIWAPEHIKLFISHRDCDKEYANELSAELSDYNISCFIAQYNIPPTKEWRSTIETALRSMDIFLAILTDGFSDSNWTNQEVGFAVARKIPIIPLKMSNKDPHGFMAIYQALQKSATENIPKAILGIILEKLPQMKEKIISGFINSTNFFSTMKIFEELNNINHFTDHELDLLVEGYNLNDQLHGCYVINRYNKFIDFLNVRGNNKFEKDGWRIYRKKLP